MKLGLIGKKLGMTQIFDEKGFVVPVTVVLAGPCEVLQLKTSDERERVRNVKKADGSEIECKIKASDGYNAIKLGYGLSVKEDSKGHKSSKSKMKEFRVAGDEVSSYTVGDKVTVGIFEGKSFVDISGVSKGKGFQGVIKRYGFAGGRATHGSHFHRAPGAIGQCAWPAKVFKGKKMPGRMGNENVTVQNLKLVDIDKENDTLLIKGSIPGPNGSYIYISPAVKKEVVSVGGKK